MIKYGCLAMNKATPHSLYLQNLTYKAANSE